MANRQQIHVAQGHYPQHFLGLNRKFQADLPSQARAATGYNASNWTKSLGWEFPAAANLVTQARCSGVSGTGKPLAF